MTFTRLTAGYNFNLKHKPMFSSIYCVSSLQVYNVIPSISSITGISPQRYIWRIVIALHVGPRFLTSLVYHRYYLTLLSRVSQSKKKIYLFHVWLALALNLIEQAALIGVTYVSNRENYRNILIHYFILQLKLNLHFSFYSHSRKNFHNLHGELPSAHANSFENPQNG